MKRKFLSLGIPCYENMSAKTVSAFGSGGNIKLAITPLDFGQAVKALGILTREKQQYFVAGAGTNLLISDDGYSGVLVLMNKLSGTLVNGSSIYAYAGESLASLAKTAVRNNLSGLEFAAGIPGSVGGAVFMNAGAFGGQISDVLDYADIYLDGEIHRFYKPDLKMSYRKSVLQQNEGIVLGAQFNLKKSTLDDIMTLMDSCKNKRLQSQPTYPSLGSVFKRIDGKPVPPMIEELGLKGATYGGAQISDQHCGFIVNKGGATSADYLNLVDLIADMVYNSYGLNLQKEVVYLDDNKGHNGRFSHPY